MSRDSNAESVSLRTVLASSFLWPTHLNDQVPFEERVGRVCSRYQQNLVSVVEYAHEWYRGEEGNGSVSPPLPRPLREALG